MTNEKSGWFDVRWMDEKALHGAALGGDPEAFAELIERYDPVVRYKIWRVLGRLVPAEALDAQIAGFWCALLADDLALLRGWDWERGELFATWIGNLALRVGGERLSRLLRDQAAA